LSFAIAYVRLPRTTGFPVPDRNTIEIQRVQLLHLQVIRIEGGSKHASSTPGIASIEATEDAVLQVLLEAGATGLEPSDLRRDRPVLALAG
jgi:hypothetical protein